MHAAESTPYNIGHVPKHRFSQQILCAMPVVSFNIVNMLVIYLEAVRLAETSPPEGTRQGR